MATVTLGGNEVKTLGNLPEIGSKAPEFTLVNTDLSELSLTDFLGKNIILNVFPSIDTPTCATSVRMFNLRAAEHPETVVICVSRDLPFAIKRFCGAEGIDNVYALSDFRRGAFGQAYGLELETSVLKGLHARAIVVIDQEGIVKYTELVSEIASEPDYQKALDAVS